MPRHMSELQINARSASHAKVAFRLGRGRSFCSPDVVEVRRHWVHAAAKVQIYREIYFVLIL